MTAGNDKKELRRGEKFVVTVQEVLHNTLLVYLEYRKVKFSGVLLNTTTRQAPYGIAEKPAESYYKAHGIDPLKIAAQEKEELEKAKDIPPPQFPQPIQTRTTYAQKLHLPPPRQIHHRRRRSKRKVRMDMMDTDLAFRMMTNRTGQKSVLHSDTCCCDKCTVEANNDSSEDKLTKGKRKLLPDAGKMHSKRKISGSYDGMTAIPESSKRAKVECSNSIARTKAVKTQLSSEKINDESHNQDTGSVKRSPAIKISYKSPGGKGRVLKIPSKIHSPLHIGERARKVVIRAKSEQFKFLNEQKPGEFLPPKHALSQSNGKSVKFGDLVIATIHVPKQTKDTVRPNPGSLSPISNIKVAKQCTNQGDSTKSLTEEAKSPVSCSDESSHSSKRLLRSVTPQVVLQPLSSKNGAVEGATSIPVPQSNADHVEEGAISCDNQPQSLSPKRKKTPRASHTMSVTRCTTRDGVKWCQGDVVWGKIHGFPWWPGILKRIIVKKAQNSLEQIAIVDWFQSKTISHIPCTELESFSGNYNKRYSKKLKGNYKKAIQEAHEAQKNMSREVRKLIMQFET